MTIQQEYDKWSPTYDTDINLTRDLDQQVTTGMFKKAGHRRVLELGCGTAKNTALLATIGREVVALDFSQGMLQAAKAKTKDSKVNFIRADITSPWPFADHSFDLITCNLVLEHIENLEVVFSEANRTLIQGGCMFICELHPFRQYQGKKARFEVNRQTTTIEAFVHHISDFLAAAEKAGLTLKRLNEWWHKQDSNKPPRLVSLLFKKW
jgi:malonyl-CoA O-methyltransferase